MTPLPHSALSQTQPERSGSVILQKWHAQRQAMKAQSQSVEPVCMASPALNLSMGHSEWLSGIAAPGRPVSERGAMSVATVYACVALIGGAMGSMTLDEYAQEGSDLLPVKTDTWYLLNEQMHPRWSAAVGWEYGMQSLLLHGDLFQRIHRVSRWSSQIESFEPLHPLAVWPDVVDDRLIYTIYNVFSGHIETVDQDDMIHVPGPGFDGRRGMSQIQYALRQPVNLATSAGQLIDSMLNDGLRPDLVVKVEGNLGEQKIADLRKQWIERYMGLASSRAPIVLGGGMDIKQISMSAADVQLIENRHQTDDEVCSIFGVMPYMIGRLGKGTTIGTTVEQLGSHFAKYTLNRHMTKIAQEIDRKVIRSRTRTVKHDVSALERGDTKSRFESYRMAIGRAGEPGWMQVNEVRRRENLPCVAGGDVLHTGMKDATQQSVSTAA